MLRFSSGVSGGLAEQMMHQTDPESGTRYLAATPLIHQYDVALCDYVRGTIRAQLGSPPDLQRTLELLRADDVPATGKSAGLKAGNRDRKKLRQPPPYLNLPSDQAFAGMVAFGLAAHPALRAYVFDELDDAPVLLLSAEDLTHLAEATHAADYRLDRYWVPRTSRNHTLPATHAADDRLDRYWVPWSELHRKYLPILQEIRQGLATGAADQFSIFSQKHGTQLECADMKLSDGVRIMADWLNELRQIKLAMGLRSFLPPPDGAYPTPSAKGLMPDDHLPVGVHQAYVTQLLNALKRYEDSKHPDAETIIKEAHINRQIGLAALRYLEAKGLYRGFKKPPQKRRQ